MSTPVTEALVHKLKKVKLFVCDVDGILTDGSVYIGQSQETKRFDIRDGLGIVTLRKLGFKVGWISNRPSTATTLRAEELKIDFLVQNKGGKVAEVEIILAATGLTWEEVSYMGDDIVDLGVLKRAGFAACVPEGVAEAKAAAHYITKATGGNGAVREVIELILKAQGHWDRLIADYSA
ncbi:KdsC family phosphatase [Pedosphaera parvula]|uniref:3-deoxy-D-manno-octulosonate 8-phosphate phosphatase, YrbI family n=1 Tax=Pedosphaera parvula (strain Ellin514) TaxID=320771 RepID=B9XMN4_PEDPL|nr:HAD hydrolase family protein [Pedosphaera parvula]EEF58933.1 3-deoxy-D-manno-octulosonate 8-phosphate phosphatase, YrbI family [Pedosphaera parvula Ellin514]